MLLPGWTWRKYHLKQGLKTSSCECASRENSESHMHACTFWSVTWVTEWLTEWRTALKAWVAIRNKKHTPYTIHPYTNVNNKIVLVFSLPGQIDWSESVGMLYIVSRDISSHLKLAMYDNTVEGGRAENNNSEYSDKKKNGRTLLVWILLRLRLHQIHYLIIKCLYRLLLAIIRYKSE